jgi:hypothetical protein
VSGDFCEFGGLPEAQCGHCRAARNAMLGLTEYGTYRRHGLDMAPVPEGVYERWAADTRAWNAAGRPLAAAARWAGLYRDAFPTEHGWQEMLERAAVHGSGPWVIAERYGDCRGCAARLEPGEMTRFCEDEDGWVCSSCGSVTPGLRERSLKAR